jgi:hypothetical protein
MAGIDYTIPGQFKGIQVESPMNAMAQAMQLRAMQESSQMNALKAQEYQRGVENRNKLARIYADPKLKAGSPEQLLRIQQDVPEEYEGAATRELQRQNILAQSEQRQADKDKREFELKQSKITADKENFQTAVSELLNYDTLDQVRNDINLKEGTGVITPAQAIALRNKLPADDAGLDTWRVSTMRGLLPPKERFADVRAEQERKAKQQDEEYNDFSLSEALAGRTVPTKEAYLRSRQGEQAAPAAAPPVAAPADADAVAPVAAPAAAPAPAPAPAADRAPGEDIRLPTDVTVAKKTGVDYLDPLAQQLYTLATRTKDKDRRLALTAMADKIQDAFRDELKNQRPVFSEINLQNEIAVVKRDPATGKTTIVDKFPVGMSPTDKQRLINESIRIKQANAEIALNARRVDLQAKRDSLDAQKAARDADPAFQQRMAAARVTGETMAKDEVKAKAMLPSLISRAEENIRLIDELVGKAPVKDKDGKIIQAGTKPHPGFSDAVGATWLPGARFIDGTDAADFARRDQQIKGASFLEAFETLKGGGSITNIEGEKGTAAINRMALAQSEQEYVAAAREVQGILRTGMERARKRAKAGASSNSGVFDAADAILKGQ